MLHCQGNAREHAQWECADFLLTALHLSGTDDGNDFVAPVPGRNPHVIIEVHEYCNGQVGKNVAVRLEADMWAFGRRGKVCRVGTDTYREEFDAIDDLADRIYSWFETGWRTPGHSGAGQR